MLHMAAEKWPQAYDEFYAAFKCYSDSGNVAARRCLKYVVLANMLSLSKIDPFDTQEAKV
jgi:COP9 signalosome complex subunit 2